MKKKLGGAELRIVTALRKALDKTMSDLMDMGEPHHLIELPRMLVNYIPNRKRLIVVYDPFRNVSQPQTKKGKRYAR